MPPVDNAYKLRNQEFLQEYAQRPGVKIMFNDLSSSPQAFSLKGGQVAPEELEKETL